MMRFLGKYELLEQLTVGTVETFSAYPIGGGERLLVHVFALPALIKMSPTNRDLLDYMEKISPPALGSLIDAGRYDDGSQAFIVTKFPRDLSAILKWVEAYKLIAKRHDTTEEVGTVELWESGKAGARPTPVAEKPVGDFTQAFQDAGAETDVAKPSSSKDSFGDRPSDVKPPRPASDDTLKGESKRRSEPGSFTEQFMGALGEGAQLPQPPAPNEFPKYAKDVQFSTARPQNVPAPDFWGEANSPEVPAELPKEASKAGEFTMFFRSPFAGQPSNPAPVLAESFESPSPSPAKGDFTSMFGPSSPSVSAAPPEPLLEPPLQEEGNFTRIFGKSAPQTDVLVSPAVNLPPNDLILKTEVGTGYVVSQNTNLPPVAQPRATMTEPVSPSPAFEPALGYNHDEGATRVFKPSDRDRFTAQPSGQQGESEYTRIVHAGAPPKPPAPVASPQSAEPAFGSIPKIPVPLPSLHTPPLQPPSPHIAFPPSPAPTPAVHWPQPPVVAVPKPPAGLPVQAGGKKAGVWTSYAPLIVILNLLLLAAVSLVLYFLFKQ